MLGVSEDTVTIIVLKSLEAASDSRIADQKRKTDTISPLKPKLLILGPLQLAQTHLNQFPLGQENYSSRKMGEAFCYGRHGVILYATRYMSGRVKEVMGHLLVTKTY